MRGAHGRGLANRPPPASFPSSTTSVQRAEPLPACTYQLASTNVDSDARGCASAGAGPTRRARGSTVRQRWLACTHARRGIDRSATEARRERPARARNLHTIATAWHFRLWRDGAGEGRAKPLNVYISRIKKYISLCFKLSAGPPAPQAAPRAVGRDIYRTCTAKHRQFARGGVPLAEYTEHIHLRRPVSSSVFG